MITVNYDALGASLRKLVQYSKGISYDECGEKWQPRVIVEFSNSRAAISGGLTSSEYRIEPVEVGQFSREEALSFVSVKMPTTLRDARRRRQLAENIVDQYDRKAVWLKDICERLKSITGGNPIDFENEIDNFWRAKVLDAQTCWETVQSKILEKLADITPGDMSEQEQKEVIRNLKNLLNDKPVVHVTDALGAINGDRMRRVTFADLSEANAASDMGGHIFYINPFAAKIGWNGKAAKRGANRNQSRSLT